MKRNDILVLLVPSFIIVILWVIFSVYHSFITSTIPEAINTQIIPINPNFDLSAIEKIKQRKQIEPFYKTSSQSAETISPSLIPTLVPKSSESGQIVPEQNL